MATQTILTADDLLAGANTTFDVVIPQGLLQSKTADNDDDDPEDQVVRIRPLTIGSYQLIMKAAKNDPGLIPLLMVKESLVDPAVSVDQVRRMPLGLVELLIDEIREVSGLVKKKRVSELSDASLLQASYILAKAFGWTPAQVQGLTMAQVSTYLDLLEQDKKVH